MHTAVDASASGARMDTTAAMADIVQPAALALDATPSTKRRKGKK